VTMSSINVASPLWERRNLLKQMQTTRAAPSDCQRRSLDGLTPEFSLRGTPRALLSDLGRREEAVETYRRFVACVPASNKQLIQRVEELITELENRQRSRAQETR
jgi:hypothetical protein